MILRKVLVGLRRVRLSEGVRYERFHMMVRDIDRGCPQVEAKIEISCSQLEPTELATFAAVDVWQRSLRELKRLSDRGQVFYVARHGGIVSGAAIETKRATSLGSTIPLREDEFSIATMFTVPEYRGNGVASALGCFICRQMAAAGFRTVISFVNVKNASSLRSFAKRGYQSAGIVGYLDLLGLHFTYCLARDARWRYRQKQWLAQEEQPGS